MDDQTNSIQELIFNILQHLTINIISQHGSPRFYNLQGHNGYHFHLLTCRRITHGHIFLTLILFFFPKLPMAGQVIYREILHAKASSKAELQLCSCLVYEICLGFQILESTFTHIAFTASHYSPISQARQIPLLLNSVSRR